MHRSSKLELTLVNGVRCLEAFVRNLDGLFLSLNIVSQDREHFFP